MRTVWDIIEFQVLGGERYGIELLEGYPVRKQPISSLSLYCGWISVGSCFLVLIGAGIWHSVNFQADRQGSSLRPTIVQYPPPEIEIPASLAELERQRKEHPKDFAVHFYLMCAYAQQGQWERSLQAARTAVQIDGSDVNAHLGIIYSYANLNQRDKALSQVESALKRPFQGWERSALLRVKGDLLMDFYQCTKKRYFLVQARDSYRQAIRHDAKNVLAQIGLVRVAIEDKQFRPAKQYLDRVLKQVRPEEPGGRRKQALALYYLGVIEELRGHPMKAKDFYRQAVQTHPQSFRMGQGGD